MLFPESQSCNRRAWQVATDETMMKIVAELWRGIGSLSHDNKARDTCTPPFELILSAGCTETCPTSRGELTAKKNWPQQFWWLDNYRITTPY